MAAPRARNPQINVKTNRAEQTYPHLRCEPALIVNPQVIPAVHIPLAR